MQIIQCPDRAFQSRSPRWAEALVIGVILLTASLVVFDAHSAAAHEVPRPLLGAPKEAAGAPVVSIAQNSRPRLPTKAANDLASPSRIVPSTLTAPARGAIVSAQVLRIAAADRGGAVLTRVKLRLPARNRLGRRIASTLWPVGQRAGLMVGSSAFPPPYVGQRVRAEFIWWRDRWVLAAATPRGNLASAAWTKLGCCWFNYDRMPVWWRTDPGVPGWASGAIKTGWDWINSDPLSYASGVFQGYGGTPDSCGQGSWVSFRDLPPGILGYGGYCADSRGSYELHAQLDYYINYDIATVAAHEILHGLGAGHSSDPNAVMYPYYTRPMGGLGTDDHNYIRHYYPGRAAFTMDTQTGIEPTGEVRVTYPNSAPIAFNLRAHGSACDPANMWLQLEQMGAARYVDSPTFDPSTGRLSLTRAPNDIYVCYARLNLRPTSATDSSPGFMRFHPTAPEGQLQGAEPSFVGVFGSPQPAERELGGIDLDGYCRSRGYIGAVLVGPAQGPNAAYDWRCRSSDGGATGISVDDACRWMYSDPSAYSRPKDQNDAYSWRCYRSS